MAGFAEVDSDLVGSAGLQTAFDFCVFASDRLNRGDVSDCALGARTGTTAADAVPSIANKGRFDRHRLLDPSMYDCDIRSLDCMLLEHTDERDRGFAIEREQHQPARIPIEPMHRVQRHLLPQREGNQLIEGRLQRLARRIPVALLMSSKRLDVWRLVYDY